MLSRLRWLAGPGLLFLITVACFWKLVLTSQYTWLNGNDLTNQVLPWLQFQAGEFHAGRFPLWDPYHWAGQSLIGQGQPGLAYPLNWILFALPLKQGWLQHQFLNWYFVAIHCMAALFAYWLARDLGRSRMASIVAGVAFAMSGFIGSNDWPQMLNGAVWAPLIVLFFLRMRRGEWPLTSAAASGFFLGVAFLSGHHQAPIFYSVMMAALWVWYLLERVTRPVLWRLGLAAVFGGFAFAASAFQTLPGYEYWKLALRWVGARQPVAFGDVIPYTVHSTFSFPPAGIAGLILPGYRLELFPFVGITLLTLAVLAVRHEWDRTEVRLFSAIALGGFVYALGRFTLPHGLLYSLFPLVDKARTVEFAIVVFNFGLAILAAYGIDALRIAAVRQSASVRRVITVVAGIAVAAWMLLFLIAAINTEHWILNGLALLGINAALLAALLAAWGRDAIGSRTALACVLLLVTCELGTQVGQNFRAAESGWPLLENMARYSDVAAFLRAQRGARVEIDKKTIPYNFGDWYGVEELLGYAGVTSNILDVHSEYGAKMLAGVKYYVAKTPQRPGQTVAFQSRDGVNVYRNPEALPRAWVAHRTTTIGDDDQMRRLLQRPVNELAREVFLKRTAPELDACEGQEPVSVSQPDGQHVTLDVTLNCRSMVVLSQNYFPGWQASVDGKRATIYEAYTFLDGIVADAGRHRIELRYQPSSVMLGAVLGLGSVVGLIALALFERRLKLLDI